MPTFVESFEPGLVGVSVLGIIATVGAIWLLALFVRLPQQRGYPSTPVPSPETVRLTARPRLAPVCGLCGYRAGGGFWTPIPFHPDAIMHTMGCGPTFPGEQQVCPPTHEWLPDGYRALQPSGDTDA